MPNKYWLSILIPSNRAEELEKFLASLMYCSLTYNNIQIIVLQDGDKENVEYTENVVLITHPKIVPLNIAKLQEICYKYASAEWIMLGNDDVICETKGWDAIVQAKIAEIKDGIGLIWPNDNMLGERLSCFPIFHRKIFDLIYPLPYRRYKVDDTIFNAFPPERRFYLGEIMFRHSNDKGVEGFQIGDGRIYPIDMEAAKHDNEVWSREVVTRYKNRRTIKSRMGIEPVVKVMIGVSTAEMARRADFYDYLNLLIKPDGMHHYLASHGQSPAMARNALINAAFENDCTHIFLLDDDVAFKPDALIRLLAHNKEVVCGLQLMRQYPHKPIIFSHFVDKHAFWRLLKPNESGLIPIVAAGLGCVLIRLTLFENMEQPWIRLGELQKDNWCDDIGFWGRADCKDMWCDLDTPFGHTASITIWPNKMGAKWFSSYDSAGTGQAHVPQQEFRDDTDRTDKDIKSEVEGQLR